MSGRNRFYHFVQNFWQMHGGMGYCDEWEPCPGRWYADLSPKYSKFKVSFSYHLELTRIKRSQYSLSVSIKINGDETLARNLICPNKKESIRIALKTIKDFESSPRMLEIWRKRIHKEAIVKDGIWIATALIGGAEQTLYRSVSFNNSTQPLGSGTFYILSLRKYHNPVDFIKWETIYKWYWKEISISGFGYSSCGCKEISYHTWMSIKTLDPKIDLVLDQAEKIYKSNKFVFANSKEFGITKAQILLDNFHKSQLESKNEILTRCPA
jgi:hypothetical protein